MAAGQWGNQQNGYISLSLLRALSWTSGHLLHPSAAATIEQLNVAYRAAFGQPITVTDSYRDYAAQVRVKAIKGDLAATPGFSNHGWALAVDLGGGIEYFGTDQHDWMRANAPAFGWILPAWAQPGGSKPEAWHWEYDGPLDTIPTTPNPSEEDDMNADQDARLRNIEATVAAVSRRNPIVLRCVDTGSANNNQIALVQGNGVHLLTPAEWNTMATLGYTITHDNLKGGPFAALVKAFGNWES
jgi:hypothetical protein